YSPTAPLAGPGMTEQPIYRFDQATVVVSLESDFLNCGPASVRYTRDFAAARRVTDDRLAMNRLYTIESTPTLTGAKADHRLALRSSQIEAFARRLASAVGAESGPGPATVEHPEANRWIAAIAQDL